MRSDRCVMHGSRETLPCPDCCESQGIFGMKRPLDSARQYLLLTASDFQQSRHLRTSRENALSMQREVSASAERHASVFQPDRCHYTGSPEQNRNPALRTEIGITAASSNMHCYRRSIRRQECCVLVSIADSSLTGVVCIRRATLKVSYPGRKLSCFYLVILRTQSMEALWYVESPCSRLHLHLHVRLFSSLILLSMALKHQLRSASGKTLRCLFAPGFDGSGGHVFSLPSKICCRSDWRGAIACVTSCSLTVVSYCRTSLAFGGDSNDLPSCKEPLDIRALATVLYARSIA